tara:strand:+ start:1972 stop:3222 length:1251 start_codon:yes stop_codon:yes gene_type:complete
MKKKVLIKGPILTRSGYGEQARFALRALRSQPEVFEIFVQPIIWGQTSWLIENDEERLWLDQTIEKTISYIQQGGQFDISLQVTIPPEWEALAPVNIGYTAGVETTKAHHAWIQKGNQMDKIIFVSNHSRQVFETSKYQGTNNQTGQEIFLQSTSPLEVVNYPAKVHESLPELELELTTSFNFLTVAQFGIRKNLENTIKWFLEEFIDDDVGLVVKTNLAKNCLLDRELVTARLRALVTGQKPERKCKVYLLHGDMTDDEIHALYDHSDIHAMLCLTHGEGYGLPMFEAAYSGMPVVCPGWSGQLDFLLSETGEEKFYNVSYDVQPVQEEAVWDGVIMAESMWCYARASSAKKTMRQCYEDVINNKGIASQSKEYAQQLHERFEENKLYKQFCDTIYSPTTEDQQWLDDLSKIELL